MTPYRTRIHYQSLGSGFKARGVLLTDSDKEAEALVQLMHQGGNELLRECSGLELLKLMRTENFDFLILDWELPDSMGRRVLGEVRAQYSTKLPILILAARSEEMDVVQALELGANDYLVKPWRPNELLARLKVLIRPVLSRPAGATENMHGFELNRINQTFTREGKEVKLTTKEFLVARTLLQYLGHPVSREYLFKTIWHEEARNGRTVDMHVSRIRFKLSLDAKNGFLLQAVHGKGYRLDIVEKPSPDGSS